ncbi:hypothetical protein ElyMa_005366500 [Elysia marginata]|uniref:Uncharacterized protein n=1 Tax=Elysia marginata TaxID=1093978 RepID=A0AAV4EDA5_9GAST|nr:hypothetical protein ElyMa_005366500 [Elysia marginata]
MHLTYPKLHEKSWVEDKSKERAKGVGLGDRRERHGRNAKKVNLHAIRCPVLYNADAACYFCHPNKCLRVVIPGQVGITCTAAVSQHSLPPPADGSALHQVHSGGGRFSGTCPFSDSQTKRSEN